MTARERAEQLYRSTYDGGPSFVVRAPGRVNLIGDHTDYNDGFVMPLALPFDTVVAGAPRPGGDVHVTSEGFGASSFGIADDPSSTTTWARYLHGMGKLLEQEEPGISGWQGAIATDIPAGASLSSSAALELAAGLAFLEASNRQLDLVDLARIAQRVENDVMGLPSGIMDQLVSAKAKAGCALLIDCRDLSTRPVPVPAGVTVVVMDTGTRRSLVESAYAERQQSCATAAAALGVPALRDATPSDLERLDDPTIHRRARHVLAENRRTLAAADALAAGAVDEVGRLMTASHESLRDDFEVSGPALDRMVEVASSAPGCLGARMTGGGFAGGTVALVHADTVDAFGAHVLASYEAPAAQPATAEPRLYPVEAAAGAGVI